MTARLVRTEAVVEGRVETRFALVEDDATPEYGEGDVAPVGVPHARLTARARLTGAATYTSDVRLRGMLEARVLRSPHANARLESIDLDAARAVPGVRAVLGPGDVPEFDGDTVLGDRPAFAGAAVAAVAADTAEAAQEALRALAPAYERLPFAVDLDGALRRQDVIGEPSDSERGDAEAALAQAEVVVEAEYRSPAQLHNSMETHCAVADWRHDGLTVWSSTQGIYEARGQLARAFGLERDSVRVICEYMGGGFGSKFGCGPEGILATALSRAAGRPVRLVFSRRDENIAAGFRTPTHFRFRIGAGRDGVLAAIEAEATQEMGAGGWVPPALVPAQSVYACPNVHGMSLGLRQHLGPSAAFRAPGVMEGAWAFEQALDELAILLELDPLELRRKNHADADPGNGRPYTSKRLLECYDRVAELAGWAGRDALRADGRVRRGMGVAGGYWWGGGGPPAYAQVRLGADGRPQVEVGMQDLGTGVVTACAIIAAERLGVAVDDVRVHWGDTSRSPHGPFSGGSMTLASVAPAVRAAAHQVRTQLLDLAADMFEIGAADLTLRDGSIRSVDGTLSEPIAELTSKLGDASLVGHGSRGPNPAKSGVNTFGCQVAQVAVDTLTGAVAVERIWAVHDSGRIVNPLGARSQVEGGVLQGLGFALMEERVVDPTTGTVVNAGLEDYKLPTIADLPEIVCEFVGIADPELGLGVKGLGEPPIVPTAAAIGNAIAHATGVRLREAPYSPRRVLEALG